MRGAGRLLTAGLVALSGLLGATHPVPTHATGRVTAPAEGPDGGHTLGHALGQMAHRVVQCHLQYPRLDEASSLVDLGDVLVTANDSGDAARIFVLDPHSCATLGVTEYAASVRDTEAMAPAGQHAVWVGDTGDNTRSRSAIALYRIPVDRGEHTVQAPRYRLVYPDGPHDAEALVNDGGRLYLITKGLMSGAVYAVPRHLSTTGTNRLERVGEAPPVVTDATVLSRHRVLVRNYGRGFVLRLPGWHLLGSFALPHERQGEAVASAGHGRALVTSEGLHAAVLSVKVPPRLLADATIGRAGTTPNAAPTGASSAPPAGTRKDSGHQSGHRGVPQGSPLPLVGLAVFVLLVSWGLRRLRRSRRG